MNDFTPDKSVKDKVVIVGQKEVEKQQKLVGSLRVKKGHTIYEVNIKNHTVAPAEFEEGAADYRKEVKTEKSRGVGILSIDGGVKRVVLDRPDAIRRKIIRKPDCIYISALNKKNAYRKLEKLGIIRFVKKSN